MRQNRIKKKLFNARAFVPVGGEKKESLTINIFFFYTYKRTKIYNKWTS